MPAEIAVLVGALIGALASVVATSLASRHQSKLESRRWKREDQVRQDRWSREDHARFHLYRRELYARFLSSVSRVFQSSSVIGSVGDNPLAKLLPEFGAQKETHTTAVDEIVMMWEEINLVGSADVVSAANDINEAVMHSRFFALSKEYGIDKLEELAEDRHQDYVKVLRPRFLAAARKELGLGELELPGHNQSAEGLPGK